MQHVIAVHPKTENIGGNEPELRSANSDDADNGAVGTSDKPTLPFVFAHQIGREQGKSARDVIETNQISRARQRWGL